MLRMCKFPEVVKGAGEGFVLSSKITKEERTLDRRALLGETEVLGGF